MSKNAFSRSLTAAAVACTVSLATTAMTAMPALAQDANTLKIGVLTDMSGPYSAMGGQGSVVAAKMAVEDCLKNE
ncbi:hypothetical protein ABTE19_22080, partial [Acinetobacter baumannii]